MLKFFHVLIFTLIFSFKSKAESTNNSVILNVFAQKLENCNSVMVFRSSGNFKKYPYIIGTNIFIPDTAKEKPVQGEVIAIGPGKVDEKGNRRILDVKKGDKVLFGKYSGTEVKIDGKRISQGVELDFLVEEKGKKYVAVIDPSPAEGDALPMEVRRKILEANLVHPRIPVLLIRNRREEIVPVELTRVAFEFFTPTKIFLGLSLLLALLVLLYFFIPR